MKLPNTPGIKLKGFFDQLPKEGAEFKIKSGNDFISILFEGYEWALIRSYNTAANYAHRKDEDTRLDSIWFDAQARVFEHLLVAIQTNGYGARKYDKEWLWMLHGRPFYHDTKIALVNQRLADNLLKKEDDDRLYGERPNVSIGADENGMFKIVKKTEEK